MNLDEFSFDDSTFDDENKLNILDEKKIAILELIKDKADQCIMAIKTQTGKTEKTAFSVISRYVSEICNINAIEGLDDMSDEDLQEIIKRIDESTAVVDYKKLLEQDAEDFHQFDLLNEPEPEKNELEDDDSGTDF